MSMKSFLTTLTGLGLSWAFAQPDSLRWDEFRPRLMTDFGHIVQGDYAGGALEFSPLNRNLVVLEQAGTYGNWTFEAGFKAVIWWPFTKVATEPLFRTIRVEPRLSQARAEYRQGDASAEFGFFPYKYNSDAQNLGEYLYRSGTYPGIVRTTDGFHLMDYATHEAYGAHFRYSHGAVTHNFNLFSEVVSIPIGDITPGYDVSLKLPLVEFGAGAAYNRAISYNPSRARPRVFQNGYFRVDSTNGGGLEYEGVYGLAPQSVKNRIQLGDSTVTPVHYYTQRGWKLMARAAVDLGFLLPEEMRSPGDLRVFAEAALLGLEDQIYFYDDKLERMPIMFGVNLPTFRLLDRLTVQGEYYRNPFESSYDFNYFAYPTWSVSEGADPDGYHRDDWKWSVHARKTVNRLLTVHVQVANDHLRLPAFNLNPTEVDLTQSPGHWYYLLRMECRL
jgi:hypothetical protein